MADFYKIADQLAKHVQSVVEHLSDDVGADHARLRVMQHLRTVLMDAMEGGRADDMASVLKPPSAPGQGPRTPSR